MTNKKSCTFNKNHLGKVHQFPSSLDPVWRQWHSPPHQDEASPSGRSLLLHQNFGDAGQNKTHSPIKENI